MKIYTKYILILLASLMFNGVHAQSKKADRLFANFDYPGAIEAYQKELKTSTKREGLISQRIAESYRMMGDYTNALSWYGKVVNLKGINSLNYFYYAKMLQSNGKHEEAEKWFEKFVESQPNDTRALRYKKYSVEKINELKTDQGKYEIAPVLINTEYDEFSPAFLGKKVAFLSNRPSKLKMVERKHVWNNMPFLDIYVADRQDNNELIDPNPLPHFNKNYHEGPVTFTKDGKRIFFTRHASRGNNLSKGTNKTVNLMIFTARKVALSSGEEKWTDPEPLSFNSTEYSCQHPTITADGQKLYFASDQPGGQGGMDIYVCDKTILGWSKPRNMGSEINTSGNEAFPFISAEGDLYFASNGHLGLGGLDIFVAKKKEGDFGFPTNLGYPVNDVMDDFGYIINEQGIDGYFTSNREGGKGRDDIYRLKVLDKEIKEAEPDVVDPKVPQLEIFVYDKITGKGLKDAVVNVFKKTGELVNAVQVNDTGFYFTERGNYTGELRFITSYKDYSSFRNVITIERLPEGNARINLPLSKDLGKVLNINPIYFDYNKANIRFDAAIELDKIVQIMKKNPTMIIEVASHTDCRGKGPYNYDLSNRRAKSSREYIISRGIAPNRIYGMGYGETQLTNQCEDGVYCSEVEHQLNRRTEFRIIRF